MLSYQFAVIFCYSCKIEFWLSLFKCQVGGWSWNARWEVVVSILVKDEQLGGLQLEGLWLVWFLFGCGAQLSTTYLERVSVGPS